MTSKAKSAPAAARKTMHEDLYEQPGHLFRRAHQICLGVFAELVGPDVTPIQYAILRAVHERPGIDQVSLARCIGVDTSTAALTAARMEGKGLINRDPSDVDRRQRVLTLTGAGEALVDQLVASVHEMRERLLGPLPEDEQEQLIALLRKFVDLHNDQSRAPMKAMPRAED